MKTDGKFFKSIGWMAVGAAIYQGGQLIGTKKATAAVSALNEKQAIFTEGARDFMTGLILYVWLTYTAELRHLVTVRQCLCLGRPDLVKDPGQDPFDGRIGAGLCRQHGERIRTG